MTESEINRAIAESVGWKWFDHPDVRERTKTWTLQDKWIQTPTGELVFPHNVPDYYNDLNAIQEAVMRLTRDQMTDYCNFRLRAVVGEGCVTDYKMINATAPQRCIAYLKAIGKYKE